MEGIIGVVVCFAGSYVPRDWVVCDGRPLSVNIYGSLFSIIGNRYGGDGITIFKVPDLRGRTAVSAGQFPGHNYTLGEMAGSSSVTLRMNNIPEHTHNGDITLHLPANSGPGIDPTVNSGFPADFTGAYSTSGGSTMLAPDYEAVIKNAGASAPIETRAPFLVITHIICTSGIYPSRS